MKTKLVAVFAILTLFFQPFFAFAAPWNAPGFHGGGHRDVVVHRLPPGYVSLLIGGLTYLYCEGLFYRYTPAGYIVVTPPAGAVVPALPAGYTTVVVNGAPYYYYGYTYYTPGPNGYVVAAPPVAPAVPATVPVAQTLPSSATTPAVAPSTVNQPAAAAEQKGSDNVFEIYIPNGNGSFTSVKLIKTEKGFLGPQGEFYEDHPTIDQLKERYTKKQ